MVVAGLGWAALSLTLAMNGHSPSRPAPFIEAGWHYVAQSIFVLPLFLASWGLLSVVAGRIAAVPTARVAPALGYAYGVPLLFTWALPDVVVLFASGFDALAMLVRVVAPVTAIYTLVLCTMAVRVVADVGSGRAFAAALGGLIAQALVGSWALR